MVSFKFKIMKKVLLKRILLISIDFLILLIIPLLSSFYKSNLFYYHLYISLAGVFIFYLNNVYIPINSSRLPFEKSTVFIISSLLVNAPLFFDKEFIPSKILSIFITFLLLIFYRVLAQNFVNNTLTKKSYKKTIGIYGAGEAGSIFLSLINRNKVLAFFDDKISLQNRTIYGINILPPAQIKTLVKKSFLEEIIIVIPSIKKDNLNKIIESLKDLPLKIKIAPSVQELISGQSLIDVRDLSIDEFLGRDIVKPLRNLMRNSISGKNILVTGAGGSIGSELCREILKHDPLQLLMLDSSEYNLYQIKEELDNKYPKKNIKSLLCSLTDKSILRNILNNYSISLVFHAAAYKHVPLSEENLLTVLYNNLKSTKNLISYVEEKAIPQLVFISSDKAVRPPNIMGASKRLCELLVQGIATESKLQYTIVRFGNVLGSSGSVIPLFKKQISYGGPVTITHKEVTRYFMSIKEAAQLVIQASSLESKGNIFVLDMGNPIKIKTLAESFIRQMGYRPVYGNKYGKNDIEIKIIGLRKGEKLHEELVIENNITKTTHPKIMKATESYFELDKIERIFNKIEKYISTNEEQMVLNCLYENIEGFDK